MARAGRRIRRERDAGISQATPRQLYNPYPPFEIASADEIEAVHDASLRVLEEIGINFLLPEARDILKPAGAEVDPDGTAGALRPRVGRGDGQAAPGQFTLHARNPDAKRAIRRQLHQFPAGRGQPELSDLERGRRSGNLADYRDLLKLAQAEHLPRSLATPMLEPIDVAPNIRYLDIAGAMQRSDDKILFGYALGAAQDPRRARDGRGSRAASTRRAAAPSRRCRPWSTPTRRCSSISRCSRA